MPSSNPLVYWLAGFARSGLLRLCWKRHLCHRAASSRPRGARARGE